ncbi:MAG: hypothetical protein JO149_00790 [Gammaproteobacteria bacterium]|nr:hypothetical protein [Gammaproteobacteria bacterium]
MHSQWNKEIKKVFNHTNTIYTKDNRELQILHFFLENPQRISIRYYLHAPINLPNRTVMKVIKSQVIGWYLNEPSDKAVETLKEWLSADIELLEIKDEIQQTTGLQTLKDYQTSDAIRIAIEFALQLQQKGDIHSIWNLAEYLKNNLLNYEEKGIDCHQEVYELYQKIPRDNPHYAEANTALVDLLDTQEITPETEENILQQKFKFSLESDNNCRTNFIYHHLRGNVGNPTIDFADKGEAFLALNKERKDFQNQIKTLQQQIEILTRKNAELEANKVIVTKADNQASVKERKFSIWKTQSEKNTRPTTTNEIKMKCNSL